ncbi:MAG: DEAD/DEAH box helicase [Candidatus Hadarchaeum sp.]
MKSVLDEIMAGIFKTGELEAVKPGMPVETLSEKIPQENVLAGSSPVFQPQLPLCDQLYSWQKEVVEKLRISDVFIVAGPGAGKTLPVLCYWFYELLGFREKPPLGKDYPFFELFGGKRSGVGKLLWCVPTRSLARELVGNFSAILVDTARQRFGADSPMAYDAANLVALGIGGVPIPNIESKLVVVGTYDRIAMLSSSFFRGLRLVVIDEAHLMFDENLSQEDKLKRSIFLLTILKNAVNARLVFLTGTLNPDSVIPLADYMKECFGRVLRIVSPSGARAGNPAVININVDDYLYSRDHLVGLVAEAVRRKKWGNVIVLFSVNAIRNLAAECLHRLQPKHLQVGFSASEDGEADSAIARIKDPFLRKCAIAGFGFHFRGKPEDMMDEDDKQIIEDLFRRRKIFFLIATDSIGIGVNLEIKNLYIPSIEKNYGTEWTRLREKDLVQLLNRVGRTLPVANIFTATENFDFIYENLIKKPHDLTISPMLKLPRGMFCRPTILSLILFSMRLISR